MLQLVERAFVVALARDAVAEQRLAPAVLEEVAQDTAFLERLEEHFLVIAGEDTHAAARLQLACLGHHARAVGPAVHEVAEQHDGGFGRLGLAIVALDRIDERLEQIDTPVNVTDDIDALSLGNGGARRLGAGAKDLAERFEHRVFWRGTGGADRPAGPARQPMTRH